MPISFNCSNCGRGYSVSDSLSNKTIICKQCGSEMLVPIMSNEPKKVEVEKPYSDAGYGTNSQPTPKNHNADLTQDEPLQQDQAWHPQGKAPSYYPPQNNQYQFNQQMNPPPYPQNQYQQNPQGQHQQNLHNYHYRANPQGHAH